MNRSRLFPKIRGISLLFLSLTLIIALCAFSGCVGEKSSAAAPSQNITQPSGTDVVLPVDSPSDLVSSNVMTKKNGVPAGSLIYEGLVSKDRNGTYQPALAESWDVSSDAKTWTFHLIHNATWQDGVPFTSADVKFTNDYLKANNLTMGFVLSDVESVTCPDDYTAVFHLKNSYSVWPDRLAQSPGIGMYPKHIYEQIQSPATWQDTQFIGTGPFRFNKSEQGYFRVVRNEEYHGALPNVTGVILKLITNKDSQVLALKNGEIDVVTGITQAVVDSLRQEPNIGIYTMNDTTGYEMGFDMVQYPTNLSSFRQAMSHAVNRDSISKILGNAHPTNTTFLMPGVAGDFVNSAETGMYDYNLTRARELLKQAGFVQDGQGILHGPDGNAVNLTIPLGGKGSVGGVDAKIVTVLRNDWSTLGITVNTASYDDESQYRKAIDKGNVFIDAMPAILHDDPDDLVDFSVTPLQEKNYYNFNNTEFNSLTGKIRNTVDREERKQIGYRMQEILAANVPTVPICSTDSYIAYRSDRFTGWEALANYPNIQDPHVLSALKPVSSGVSKKSSTAT
jgi:peptide/nickel transport system substrate-binding protein